MSDNTQVRNERFNPTIPLALLLVAVVAYFLYIGNSGTVEAPAPKTYYGYTDAQIRQYMAEYGCSEAEVKSLIRMTGGR